MSDPIADFFATEPLSRRETERLELQRKVARRNDAHDETGSMSEDEERSRSDWPR
jgi:hypothetical protein